MTTALWLLGGLVALILLNRLVCLAFWGSYDKEYEGAYLDPVTMTTYEGSGIVPGGTSWYATKGEQ
jgi:uncharacterized membrane protein